MIALSESLLNKIDGHSFLKQPRERREKKILEKMTEFYDPVVNT